METSTSLHSKPMDKGREVGRRRLSVFDLPSVDTALFVPRKRRLSIYNSPHNVVTPSARLSSAMFQQDWQRFGWNKPMDQAKSHNKSVFITRSKTDIDAERKSAQSSREASSLMNSPRASALSQNQRETTSLFLPALPTNGRGDPMLRRPTLSRAPPVLEDGDVFFVINKGKELKPLSFLGDETKSNAYYNTHFPLLLERLADSLEDDEKPSARKGITEKQARERLKQSTACRRILKLRQRMKDTERQLVDLEKHPDGADMVTELRDAVFNPLLWTWNLARNRMILKENSES